MLDRLNNLNLKRAKKYILLALFFSIPLAPKVSTLLTILFILLCLWEIRKIDFRVIKGYRDFSIYIIIYVFLLIGLLYSIDVDTGLSKIQTQVSLFIFPIFLGSSVFSRKDRDDFMSSFVYGTLITLGLAFLNAAYRFYQSGTTYIVDELSRKHSIFFYDEFSKFLDLHPTYFSLYLSLALFFLIFTKNSKNHFSKFSRIGLSIFLFVGLFFTSSKAGIFSFLLIITGYLIYQAVITKHRNYIYFLVILLMGGSVMLFMNPVLVTRTQQMVSSMNKVVIGGDEVKESTGIRLNLWYLSLVTAQEKLAFGYGTGSVFKALNENCIHFYSFSTCEGLRNKNSHNEYLNFLLSNGLLVLILFISALAIGLIRAIKNRDILSVLFLTFMIFNFFFESLLQRERGVLFFSIFVVMLSITQKKQFIKSFNER